MIATLPITVIVAARNEEANLPKCLGAIGPAQRVLIIDSHSSDQTAEIAANAGAEVVQFDYTGAYPKKRQWALDNLAIETPWVLMVDADEVVPEALWEEIADALSNDENPVAWLITKGFHFMGKRFRFGGFSHRAVLLFRNGMARFEHLIACPECGQDMEVHERLIVDGQVGVLKTPLIHEDYKGLQAYLHRHNQYSTWEAQLRHHFLSTGQYGEDSIRPRLFGNAQERRRFLKHLAIRIPFEPWLWFVYHYLFRLGFLEGRAGYAASRIRSSYIADVRAKMDELRQAPRTEAVVLP